MKNVLKAILIILGSVGILAEVVILTTNTRLTWDNPNAAGLTASYNLYALPQGSTFGLRKVGAVTNVLEGAYRLLGGAVNGNYAIWGTCVDKSGVEGEPGTTNIFGWYDGKLKGPKNIRPF